MKTIVTMALVAALAAVPVAGEAAGGAGEGGCSISCWNGTSCSASGVGPCECRCRGILGLGGAMCSCLGAQFANPVGD